MPITTFLHDAELKRPTGDSEINALLAEVRMKSRRNYLVFTQARIERFGPFWLRKRTRTLMTVYLEVGGVGPWQEVLPRTQDAATVRAYLLGMLNGYEDAMRSNA